MGRQKIELNKKFKKVKLDFLNLGKIPRKKVP